MSTAATTNNNNNKPLIIFCHGSGDTGAGAQQWIQSLVPPQVMEQFDWHFPTATPMPYSLAGGAPAHVWFDRAGGFEPTHPEQTASVEPSAARLMDIIETQVNHRAPSRVAIGGFSTGGGIALQTTARWHDPSRNNKPRLGAIFAMSSYLNNDSKVWTILEAEGNGTTTTTNPTQWPPTFLAHGADDDFILPEWGQSTAERLGQQNVPVERFRVYPETHHEMARTELSDLMEFLDQSLNVEAATGAPANEPPQEL